MYKIKIKERPMRTGITLYRKIFGIWIYINGYNVDSATIGGRKNSVINLMTELQDIYKIPTERVLWL